jgi:hypothetical protein
MATAVVTAPVVAARGQVSSLKFFLSFAKFLFGFGGKSKSKDKKDLSERASS